MAKLDVSSFQANSGVYVIQQNCDYYSNRDCYHTKKISRGTASVSDAQITHNADTLGGSSGSPVFSSITHEVVGIHHAGLGNNGQGRGVENYAVSMSKIVPYIQANFPSIALGAQGGGSPSAPPVQVRNNDTMEGATLMGRFKRVRGAIDSSKDIDYFEFEVDQSDRVAIDLVIASARVDLDIYLIEKGAGLVAKSESITTVEEVSEFLSAGTYYVLVKGYRGAVGNYTLTIR